MSGTFPYGKDQNADYVFRLRSARLGSEGQPRVIRIDGLHFEAGKPSGRGGSLSMNAEIDVREGQYAVVGKTGIEGADKALILVLTAKVVE